MQFSPLPYYPVPCRPKYSPPYPIAKHPKPTLLPQCERSSFTPIQNNMQNYSSECQTNTLNQGFFSNSGRFYEYFKPAKAGDVISNKPCALTLILTCRSMQFESTERGPVMFCMRVRTLLRTRCGRGLRTGTRTEHNSKCSFPISQPLTKKKTNPPYFIPFFFMRTRTEGHNI